MLTRPAHSLARRALLRDAQELLAFVVAPDQPPQRRRRVLQAMLHVDLVLELSTCTQPARAPIASAMRDT